MKRYTAILRTEFAIEAENVVQARLIARRIRSLGEVSGWRRATEHDSRGVRYRVTRVQESVTVEARAPGDTGKEE